MFVEYRESVTDSMHRQVVPENLTTEDPAAWSLKGGRQKNVRIGYIQVVLTMACNCFAQREVDWIVF